MADVFIGLGSNVGDPAAQLKEALGRLAAHVALERVSSAYRTDPIGLRDQPPFLNAVARGRTDLPARELLAVMAGIEDEMGRKREVRFGPRTIDLDLLLYDDLTSRDPGLSLPHPRMADRRFVLVPLAEIAPETRLPPDGPTVAELLSRLPGSEAVDRIDLEGWPPPFG